MSERGEYRSIRTVLIDGPDFQRLPERANHIFLLLKLNFGAAGIQVFYPDELAIRLSRQANMNQDQVLLALDILEHEGWIRREKNIVWIVGHLDNDPHWREKDPKHRKGIQQQIAGLPRLAIVRAFIESSKGWFPEQEASSMGLRWAFEDPSKNRKRVIGGSSKQKKEKKKKKEEEKEKKEDLPTSWVALLVGDWKELTGGLISHGKLGALLKPLVDAYGTDRVRPAFQSFARDTSRNKYGMPWFVEHFGDYDDTKLIGVGGNFTADELAEFGGRA